MVKSINKNDTKIVLTLFIARNRACFDEEEFIYVTECP